MTDATIAVYMTQSLTVFLIACGPPLVAALVVGLVISVLQAATQIQDQTLPQTFKLVAVFAALVVLGPLVVGSMVELGERVFIEFPLVVR